MDFHFSQETLRKDLEELSTQTAHIGAAKAAGRANCAEARFEIDQTVLRMANLAHLSQAPTD